MKKVLKGKVVSAKQQDTVVVEVLRRVAHPLYKRMVRKTKRYQVDTNGHKISEGMEVRIEETVKMAKNKYFKIVEGAKK